MTRRPALDLDHLAAPRRFSGSGAAVLALSLLAAAGLAYWQHDLRLELDALQLQQRLASARMPRSTPPAQVDPRRLDEALRRAQHVSLEMGLPWTALFDAIETAADPSVALLAIEPDARRAVLRVTAEARHKQAMLDYMARLGAQPPFLRTVLESHAQEARGNAATVRFTLIARWEPQS